MYNLELRPRRHFWNTHSFFEKELDKLLDTKTEEFYTPACEITETEKQYLVSMDIPGINKEDIGLEVKENQLYVTGKRKWESKSEKDNVLRSERRYGKFSRVFTLPQNVNADMIEARFENGVLEILLPKEEKAQTRKISIMDKKADDTTVN
jgi:HSP20 family protein